jgi:hypothetical protein
VADIATTNRYVHYLGSSAEETGLALLNAPGATPGHLTREGPHEFLEPLIGIEPMTFSLRVRRSAD